MAVDIDLSSPTLTFNLAMTLGWRLEVWRVCLVHDSQSSRSELIAQQLVSFQPEPFGLLSSISILGDYLAYSVDETGGDKCYATVLDWMNLGEMPSNYDKWIQQTDITPTHVRLLPGNRIILRRGWNLELYNFLLFTKTKVLTEPIRQTNGIPPLWTASTDTYTKKGFIPEPILCKDSIRIITATRHGVYGVILKGPEEQPDGSHDGELIKLRHIPRGTYSVQTLLASYGYNYSAS
ncbi:hypothetical protein AX16_007563 [Volvariella volvacea WC 439]|nr:hypothetical protein AX16_007563 [Volvariella volvacea WC 439]